MASGPLKGQVFFLLKKGLEADESLSSDLFLLFCNIILLACGSLNFYN
jgi:hypothetical protein